jgi:hypothetical protein
MFGPSSINWCELDYIKSEYIAEYWNTLTGIFLIISSLYSYIKNYDIKHHEVKILHYSNILLFIVGIGTMMFHGTLVYIWQLLDEIPMMLIVIEYYRILTIELDLIHYTKSFVLYYKTLYHIIPVIISSYYIYPKLQMLLFQGALTLYILLLVYTCYNINKNLNTIFYKKNPFNYMDNYYEEKTMSSKSTYSRTESEMNLPSFSKQKRHITRKTYVLHGNNQVVDMNNSVDEFIKYSKIKNYIKYHNYRGILLLFFSLLIWNIDNHFCQHYIELHAIWHITTSIGMYSCNEIIKSYIILNKQLV